MAKQLTVLMFGEKNISSIDGIQDVCIYGNINNQIAQGERFLSLP